MPNQNQSNLTQKIGFRLYVPSICNKRKYVCYALLHNTEVLFRLN